MSHLLSIPNSKSTELSPLSPYYIINLTKSPVALTKKCLDVSRESPLNRISICYNNPMLITVDDSGDPGVKPGAGSSKHFVIAAVCFETEADAERMRKRINKLKD